jgi:hypothetical protein
MKLISDKTKIIKLKKEIKKFFLNLNEKKVSILKNSTIDNTSCFILRITGMLKISNENLISINSSNPSNITFILDSIKNIKIEDKKYDFDFSEQIVKRYILTFINTNDIFEIVF